MDDNFDTEASINLYFIEEGMAMDVKGETETLLNMLSSAASKMINDVSEDTNSAIELTSRFNTMTILKLLRDEA